MDIKERAREFAIKAHKGQIRKNEPDKPKIIHPISVALILEKAGCDENVIAAGYLHDIVEDTSYTIDDITKEFGNDIANLVKTASEPNKSLSWEERKAHTIETTKNLPLRNKLIICADKINNLEDIMIKSQKEGKKDFSLFNRGEESQKWYYTNIYNSLIYKENEENELFKRLKKVIDTVFYDKEDMFLKEKIFDDNINYYEQLKKLHAQKVELERLKELCTLTKPYVIEFTGTPRTGKTTTINNLYDFFNKGGFKVYVIEELTNSKKYKEEIKKQISELNVLERNLIIAEESRKQLENIINSDNDIIIVDRSLNDRQIWNYIRYLKGDIDQNTYQSFKEKYLNISKELIDYIVITYADPLVSLKRDYNCSLALEKRNFLNLENIEEFNNSLDSLKKLFEKSVKKSLIIDTSTLTINDVAIETASNIMPEIRKEYIKSLHKRY